MDQNTQPVFECGRADQITPVISTNAHKGKLEVTDFQIIDNNALKQSACVGPFLQKDEDDYETNNGQPKNVYNADESVNMPEKSKHFSNMLQKRLLHTENGGVDSDYISIYQEVNVGRQQSHTLADNPLVSNTSEMKNNYKENLLLKKTASNVKYDYNGWRVPVNSKGNIPVPEAQCGNYLDRKSLKSTNRDRGQTRFSLYNFAGANSIDLTMERKMLRNKQNQSNTVTSDSYKNGEAIDLKLRKNRLQRSNTIKEIACLYGETADRKTDTRPKRRLSVDIEKVAIKFDNCGDYKEDENSDGGKTFQGMQTIKHRRPRPHSLDMSLRPVSPVSEINHDEDGKFNENFTQKTETLIVICFFDSQHRERSHRI